MESASQCETSTTSLALMHTTFFVLSPPPHALEHLKATNPNKKFFQLEIK